MAVERMIGIDFGTSTSVVKIKTYSDQLPVGSLEIAESLRFDNKDTIPSLVYETRDGRYLFGYEAEHAAMKGVLHQNFKLDLISTDSKRQESALRDTKHFFEYLYEAYTNQKTYFTACDLETTYISYPAKWPERMRHIMIDIASTAGFKNVQGIDEPTAAMQTVMVQEENRICLEEGHTANILMIDMGAGTTDLVLCNYAQNRCQPVKILNVWPKADCDSLFGGSEIDLMLCNYLKEFMEQCGLPNTAHFKEKYLDKCKSWKENNVSPVFRDKDGVVYYCGFMESILSMLDIDIQFPPLTREVFEDKLSAYLTQYIRMINDCMEDAGFAGEDLDYVILTGGHSQWYFTNEILDGRITRFGKANLTKINKDKNRIIKLARPQETVALGLVYQKIDLNQRAYEKTEEYKAQGSQTEAYQSEEYKKQEQYEKAEQNQAAQVSRRNKQSEELSRSSFSDNSNVYPLAGGKNIRNIAENIKVFLQERKLMETQVFYLEGGGVLIQAKARGGNWKVILGVDQAVTICLNQIDERQVGVEICESKWVEKVGSVKEYLRGILPLSVTAGLGMFIQARLPQEIDQCIKTYLYEEA